MGKEFSGENQPKIRKPRGPSKLKKVIPLLESLKINPLRKAILKAIILDSGADTEAAFNAWITVAKFVYPQAKEDIIASTPEQSVSIAKNLLDEVQKLNDLPIDPRIDRSSLEKPKS